MEPKPQWVSPRLIALGTGAGSAENGNPSKQNIDLGSALYAS